MTIVYICSYCARRWERTFKEERFVALDNIIMGICRDCFKSYQRGGIESLNGRRPVFAETEPAPADPVAATLAALRARMEPPPED